MQLYPAGYVPTTPETVLYWNTDRQALLELTFLTEHHILIRATKGYRLLKQDEEGQKTWTRNLGKLNDYLADTFSQFQLQLDYTDHVTTDIAVDKNQLETEAEYAQKLIQQRKDLEQELDSLEQNADFGLEQFQGQLDSKIEDLQRELEAVDQELTETLDYLNQEKDLAGELGKNGVSAAITFTFSTDPEIIPPTDLEAAADDHLETVYNHHRRKVKQTLQGSNFRLAVDEIQNPAIFQRLEQSTLLNPEALTQLLDDVDDSQLKTQLQDLQKQSAAQYAAYALEDITVDGKLQERSKATPARAVSTLLQNLETVEVTPSGDVPNSGPIIGTVPGTSQVLGFDPADGEHYYIVGGTGSGKSYQKRVLIENIASLGYNVLSITPNDRQGIGAAFPNDVDETFTHSPETTVTKDDAKALSHQQYWIGNDLLKDRPANLDELYDGVTFVTLDGATEAEKQEFVTEIFQDLSQKSKRTTPLFVFLEEAHHFASGDSGQAIQEVVREARKFGIHVVLSTQSPMDFNRNYKHVRENTTGNFFLNGEYFDYAKNFDLHNRITDLETGQAIYFDRDNQPVQYNVRPPLSRVEEPTLNRIQGLDDDMEAATPDWEEPSTSQSDGSHEKAEDKVVSLQTMTDDEKALMQFIKAYIDENDQRPSYSKCHRHNDAPFGTSKTRRLLDQLLEKNLVTESTETRYGNESKVYGIQ